MAPGNILIFILIIIFLVMLLLILLKQHMLNSPVESLDRKYKYNLCLLLIVKNEEMILDEFFRHYMWQGVEHFYVIDNGSTDRTKDIINRYPTTYYYLDEKYQQVKHYNTVYKEIKNDCKWLIVCDCDEYIYNREKSVNIKDYLDTLDYSKISNIDISWKLFGSSGLDKQPKSIRKSFVYRKEELSVWSKQIVNTSLTHEIGIHNSEHGIFRYNSINNPDQLALNHYVIMSKEYFSKVKMVRGNANTLINRDWDFFDKNDHNNIHDTELCDLLN